MRKEVLRFMFDTDHRTISQAVATLANAGLKSKGYFQDNGKAG